MTDPYLQALDDVAGELRRLQDGGPEIPAFHRGPVLEALGRLASAIDELRLNRGRDAGQHPPSALVGCPLSAAIGSPLGTAVGGWIGVTLVPPYAAELLGPLSPAERALVEDRADWDAAPRW